MPTKSKRKDSRPARIRYWAKRQLEKTKIKHLIKYCGMTREQATRYWNSHRIGRVPDKFLRGC